MQKLPLNAQQFFSANKPQSYLYHSPPEGLITGRKVEVIGAYENMENQPLNLIPPHLQPRVTASTVVIPQRTTQTHRVVVPAKQPEKPKRPPITKKPVVLTPSQQCKYMTLTKNPGCNCSSIVCGNNECVLSRILPHTGKKAVIGINTCQPQNCRWFTPREAT